MKTPSSTSTPPMKVGLLEMTSKRMGVTGVCNKQGAVGGVITDGDVRGTLEKEDDVLNKKAHTIMTANPKTISKDDPAATALRKMEEFSITSLFILSGEQGQKPVGIIHMHDLLRAGVV